MPATICLKEALSAALKAMPFSMKNSAASSWTPFSSTGTSHLVMLSWPLLGTDDKSAGAAPPISAIALFNLCCFLASDFCNLLLAILRNLLRIFGGILSQGNIPSPAIPAKCARTRNTLIAPAPYENFLLQNEQNVFDTNCVLLLTASVTASFFSRTKSHSGPFFFMAANRKWLHTVAQSHWPRRRYIALHRQ
eukprot:jgi/Mesvir1/12283/Mv26420-RA.1